MSVFGAQKVSKWFGQIVAVNELSFSTDVPILGLLGPNGAGKSTLLKLLVGQLRPSSGSVGLLGQRPWANRELMARIGYCPEHDRFYEDMAAAEFVRWLCRLHGFDAAGSARRAAEALERVGLQALGDRSVRSLSHGMRQRLKVAQALAHGPEVLVLDEPLSGLDPLGRAEMIELFRELAASGCHLLVSSHVLHELEAMTVDILLLNRGRVLAQGQVQRIRELIDAHPHRIAMTAGEPRALAVALLRHADVMRVEIDGPRVVVETRKPDECFERIGELASAGDFDVQSLVGLDDNLEAVFQYLVHDRPDLEG
ncbi:MAG: ABC transporter ATP-binding protein [Deltaproteobacteria bacterium]|nr:ABC transporter ATP-binding protein [Deltaproteobacteria bacterium]